MVSGEMELITDGMEWTHELYHYRKNKLPWDLWKEKMGNAFLVFNSNGTHERARCQENLVLARQYSRYYLTLSNSCAFPVIINFPSAL